MPGFDPFEDLQPLTIPAPTFARPTTATGRRATVPRVRWEVPDGRLGQLRQRRPADPQVTPAPDFTNALRNFREAIERQRAAARAAADVAPLGEMWPAWPPQEPQEPLKKVAEPITLEEEPFAKLVNPFLVGCDPEFVVLKGDNLVNVQALLPHTGEVGWDHGGSCIELRPKPAKGTLTMVKRLQKLIQGDTLKSIMSAGKWRGGAMIRAKQRMLTLGGHVHLDVTPPGFDLRHEEEAQQRLKALDRLTAHLEKLDILPQNECADRRANSNYGQWSEFRVYNDHVHPAHLEYRTMASWLFHPVTAFICLTGAKLAAVAPQVAIDTLRPKSVSYENLVNFFEFFRHKDLNAAQVLDKLIDNMDIKALQKDPDGDMKEAWKELVVA